MKQYKEVYVRVILFNSDIIVESKGIDASDWDNYLGE